MSGPQVAVEDDPRAVAEALQRSKEELQASLEELERRARAEVDLGRAVARRAVGALALAFAFGFVLGWRSR